MKIIKLFETEQSSRIFGIGGLKMIQENWGQNIEKSSKNVDSTIKSNILSPKNPAVK